MGSKPVDSRTLWGAAALLLAGADAHGAVALKQHAAVNSVAHVQSFTLTLADPTTPGDFLLVVGGWSPLTYVPLNPTDNFGNTFRAAVVSAGDQLVAVYYAAGIDGGQAHVVTWSVDGGPGGTTPLSIEVAEFSGIDPVRPFVQIVSGAISPSGGANNLPDSGLVTPTLHGSLVVGAMAHDAQFLTDAGDGWTLLDVATDDAVNSNPAIDEYLIDDNATPVAATFTLTGAAPWAAVAAVFQPAVTTLPDAGEPPDGGGSLDAGATEPDAGRIDSGQSDAGGAGPRRQLDIGCGCSETSALPFFALAVGLAVHLRRKRPA